MIDHSCRALANPALLTVTHMECAIMNTPDGELWDKSVLEKYSTVAFHSVVIRALVEMPPGYIVECHKGCGV